MLLVLFDLWLYVAVDLVLIVRLRFGFIGLVIHVVAGWVWCVLGVDLFVFAYRGV